MFQRIFSYIIIPLLLMCTAIVIIAYARGYRLDVVKTATAIISYALGYKVDNEPYLNVTGILAATSDPTGAQIYVDGDFSAATESNINLVPGKYEVAITKEGYHEWRQTVDIRGEVATSVFAVLFLKNPSLAPLIATTATNPMLSPDGTKLAYIASPAATLTTGQSLFESSLQRPTLFLYDLSGRTMPFSRNPQPYNGSRSALLREWDTETRIKGEKSLAAMPDEFQQVATDSVRIIQFSPDETKVFYEATGSALLERSIRPALIGVGPKPDVRELEQGNFYVYDLREDRNYDITSELGTLAEDIRVHLQSEDSEPAVASGGELFSYSPMPLPVFWLGNSQHFALIENSTINIMEYHGGNKVTVYSGPFENGFVFPHPSGRQLIIMTTLNPEVSPAGSLYTLNIR